MRCRRDAATDAGADELGMLDQAAIDRVRDEARPDPRNADELHDALMTCGYLLDSEMGEVSPRVSRYAGRRLSQLPLPPRRAPKRSS